MHNFEREQTAALRLRVAKLERMVNFLLQELKIEYVDQPDQSADAPYLALIRANKKMDAIKLYRENTGVDLGEAKQYIESLEGDA